MVSALSWYQWTESVWVEEAKQKLRVRAEASRQRRINTRRQGSVSDISSASVSNDDSPQKPSEDDEDISIIDDKSIEELDEEIAEIEELMAVEGVRQRKKGEKFLDAKEGDGADESAC